MEIIKRQHDINRISKLLKTFRVVAVLGPRLCGKTTLARQLNFDHLFDLGLREHAERLAEPMRGLQNLKGLIVLDEIHLMPALFDAVKNIVDSRSDAWFVVLGSASLVIFRHTSRHLAGRMVPYEIGGLTLADVGKENMMKHIFRGGLPGSYLAPSDDVSLHWRENYLNQYFPAGFADEGFGLSSHILKRIWHIIAGMQGSPVNLTRISHELRISIKTANRYLEALEATSLVRSLDFCKAENNGSATGRPKFFIRDSGLLASLLGVSSSEQILEHSHAGRLWEAYALETLIKHVEFQPVSYAYWRGRAGRELDLVWKKGDRLVGAYFKLLPSFVSTKLLEQVIQKLDLEHLWVVHAGSERHELGDKITALPLADMLPGENLRLSEP
jgi:predicted AAA+ superfamily ATPase